MRNRVIRGVIWVSIPWSLLATGNNPGRVLQITTGQSCNGAPFQYTERQRETNTRYTLYDITFPSPVVTDFAPNNTIPGELYMPLGTTPDTTVPGVVCLHILNGNYELERMMCAQLAQNGVAALFFKLPYYGERGGKSGRAHLITNPELLVQGLQQGVQDARRALDILATRPEIAPQHLGITGISLGAFLSAAICGQDQRIHKSFLLLGGGNLRKVIETARETRRIKEFLNFLDQLERERVLAAIDSIDPLQATTPLRRLGKSGRLRMVNAELDQVVPKECTEQLAEAAGIADEVLWLKEMDHYTAMAGLPQIMREVVAFFSTDTPATWHPPAGSDEKNAPELLGAFLSGLATLLSSEPSEGCAHMLGVRVDTELSGKRYEAQCDVLRGDNGRFKINGSFPFVGNAGLGQGESPWIMGAGKKVFYGSLEATPEASVTALVTPERMLRYRIFTGALSVAALSPEALKQYYTLSDVEQDNGELRIKLEISHKKTKGSLALSFLPDATPVAAKWSFNKSKGTAHFPYWRRNAPVEAGLYEPSDNTPRQEVRQEDVLRMLSASFEYLLEAVE